MPEESQNPAEVGGVKPVKIEDEMQSSYLDYAMSVIVARALPDVRDGLKPVHRRILYAMWEMGLKHNAKFRKSATVVGECFVKDTMVLTRGGLIPIQEIKVGDLVYTQKGIQKVIQLYEMPEKPLLKVTLENGISNIVTYSQKFKVLTEDWKFKWKEAKDLTKNDYLVIKAAYPKINNFVKLNRIEKNQPQYLNENLAYLLGILISDGCIAEDYGRKKYPRIHFGLGEAKEKAVERIISIFKKEFNYNPTLEVDNYQYRTQSGKILNNKRYQIRINRKSINEFFLSNFELKGLKAPTKRIPSKIFQSPPKVIFSFISGLIDGDGCVMPGKHCIQYGSSSKKLIDGLSVLLLHQGIFSSQYLLKNKEAGYINGRIVKGRYQPYSLEIRGKNATLLAKSLNLASVIKRKKIQKIIKQEEKRRDCGFQYDIIPYAGRMLFGELRKNHLGAGWYQDIDGDKFRMGIKHRAGCKIRYSSDLWEKPLRKTQVIDWGIKNKLERIDSPLFEFLERILKNKIYLIKISSIRKVSPQKTYDFEVENDHELIANGVVSHNCMGKYHPHGDVAVYDSLVNLTQDFKMRYPLISGQGNFGSLDGDRAAAMRYTEAKMSRLAEEMLADIEKNTVPFMDNYDGTRQEPIVLPASLPNLLLNGTLGIAVGMATNIPPHNLSELVDSTSYLIDHPEASLEELLEFVSGPDFPTGGIIYDFSEIKEAYATGKGRILMRAKAEIEETKKGFRIIISELPYQVNKAILVARIAELCHEKKLEGVVEIRDESGKEGLRIVLDLKKDSYPHKVLNQLYKYTPMQSVFHVNMLALTDGLEPRLLTLKMFLEYFIRHRQEVVRRRSEFELEQARLRAHILEGLKIALAHLDAVIKTIKGALNRQAASDALIKKFKLTRSQAEAILEMRLQQLSALERQKIEDEYKEKIKLASFLTDVLGDPKKILKIIKEELALLKEKYGDTRRTKVIKGKIGELADKDLIPNQQMVVTVTHSNYVKRLPLSTYRSQRRGGKGVLGMGMREEDEVKNLILAFNHDDLLFFTSKGRLFRLKVYELPQTRRQGRGQALVNLLSLQPQESVTNVISLPQEKVPDYLVMATKKGLVKKTAIEKFTNLRKSGLIAIRLRENDELKWVATASSGDELIIISQGGQAIRFKEEDIRGMGRVSSGVRGIRLRENDRLVGMDVLGKEEKKGDILVVTENGYGKRTPLRLYHLQKRGGIGIKTARINSKTGKIIGSAIIGTSDKELVVISRAGQVIKVPIKSISRLGRVTSGVKIMRLNPDDKVASIYCVIKEKKDEKPEGEVEKKIASGKDLPAGRQVKVKRKLVQKPAKKKLIKKKEIKKKLIKKKPVARKLAKKKKKKPTLKIKKRVIKKAATRKRKILPKSKKGGQKPKEVRKKPKLVAKKSPDKIKKPLLVKKKSQIKTLKKKNLWGR